MENENSSKKLSTLEAFFQFNVSSLSEQQRDTHSIIALIVGGIWFALSLFGISFGVLWLVLISSIFFKIVSVGLKSGKRWMSIVAIVLYVLNIGYWILCIVLRMKGYI